MNSPTTTPTNRFKDLDWDLLLDRNGSAGPSYLTIKTRNRKLDSHVRQALAELVEPTDCDGDPDQELRDLINELDMASTIKKVTDRLNRTRMSDMERQVLSKTYKNEWLKRLRKMKADRTDPAPVSASATNKGTKPEKPGEEAKPSRKPHK